MTADNRFDLWGCVVGRFQPFHRDHVSLIAQAAAARGRVVVAVTAAEASWRVPVPEAPHRHLAEANVFTYWQRAEMVLAGMSGIVALDRIRVTPFPIHDPSCWDAYLPREIECWVRDRGPWEQEKMRVLQTRYAVRSVDAVANEVSGTDIRRRLAMGDESWQHDVPASVARLIRAWRLDVGGR